MNLNKSGNNSFFTSIGNSGNSPGHQLIGSLFYLCYRTRSLIPYLYQQISVKEHRVFNKYFSLFIRRSN
ncbi:hypothetical protein SAMN05518855_1001214 [Paenibacillus sp. CF384]|nr:hypothetical protein SAMN05518855_1001214 [Paenibacillus sp. CF384]